MTSVLPDDERSDLAAAILVAALLIAEQVAARAVRDTLFLGAFQVRSLPLVMIASALVAFGAAELLAFALARRSPARAMPTAALVSSSVLVLLYLSASAAPRVVAVLVYLQVAAFGGALVSGFWSTVNERFDPWTARRVVGRIGAGATIGGIAGGLLAWLGADLVPLRGMLLLLAALHAAAGLVLGRRSRGRARVVAAESGPPRLGLALALRTPYLRLLALVVFLGACGEAILDFSFKAQAARSFAPGATLLGAFALFHAAMSIASLLLQLTAVRPVLQSAGIAGAVAARPILTGSGSLLAAVFPSFGAAALARGVHDSLTNSLFRSGYELLYTPLAEAEKRRVKAVVDVVMDKAGTLVGSALVLAAMALPSGAVEHTLFVCAALVSLAALSLSRPLRRGYVSTLERSLLAGSVRLAPEDVVDRTTELTLTQTSLIQRSSLLRQIEVLRATLPDTGSHAVPDEREPSTAGGEEAPERPSPERLLEAVAVLRSGDPDLIRWLAKENPDPPPLLVAAMIPLLASDRLVVHLLPSLRRAAPRTTGQLVDALLDPKTDRAVRRRIPRVLKTCPTPRAVAGLLEALGDPSFEIRTAAGAALAVLHEQGAVSISRETVLQHVRRELDGGEPVDRQLPQLHALLSLALDKGALAIVWASLKGGEEARADRALRGTALEYLSSVLPEDLFGRLVVVLGASSYGRPGPGRAPDQVAQELRTSAAGLRIEAPPWSKPGDD